MFKAKVKCDGDEKSKINEDDVLVVKSNKIPVVEGEEEADSILKMEPFEGFDYDDGDTTITEDGGGGDDVDDGGTCNDKEIQWNNDEEEAVALLHQTYLAAQRPVQSNSFSRTCLF